MLLMGTEGAHQRGARICTLRLPQSLLPHEDFCKARPAFQGGLWLPAPKGGDVSRGDEISLVGA